MSIRHSCAGPSFPWKRETRENHEASDIVPQTQQTPIVIPAEVADPPKEDGKPGASKESLEPSYRRNQENNPKHITIKENNPIPSWLPVEIYPKPKTPDPRP